MKISRAVGTTGELVPIFVQDATVSTGTGFPNLEISTFSSYYHRSDMTSTSSVTLVSTGTLGTWSSGQFLQINSTFMRGWYQFCLPDGVWANGSTCAVHMYGHPSMAPVVMEFDIQRFNNQSAVVNANPVGVSSFGIRTGVSSFDVPVGVSSFGIRVGVSSIDQQVGVSTFNSRVGVSSFGLPVGVSSMAIGVSVTSFDSRVGVSSFGLPVGVSSMAIGVGVTTFNSRVGVSSFDIPVGVSSMAIGVGVTSFNSRVGVSSFGIDVGVSSNPIGVNVTSVTGLTVVGTGTSSDPWGP